MGTVTNFLKSNIGAIGAGVGGAALGSVVGYAAGRRSSKSRSRRKSSVRHTSVRSRSGFRKKRTRRTPHTAGKRKDRSTRRIRYTKRGQPYVLMANGKARFISKKGARSARKRRGGRY